MTLTKGWTHNMDQHGSQINSSHGLFNSLESTECTPPLFDKNGSSFKYQYTNCTVTALKDYSVSCCAEETLFIALLRWTHSSVKPSWKQGHWPQKSMSNEIPYISKLHKSLALVTVEQPFWRLSCIADVFSHFGVNSFRPSCKVVKHLFETIINLCVFTLLLRH